MSYMREIFGDQTVVQLFAVLGLLLAVITYWIVPDMKSCSQETVLSDVKEVLSNKRVIWSCIFAGLMVGPLEGFADVWGTIFLKQVYGFDERVAASIPSMIFMGMCFGAPVLSLIADRVGNLATIIGSGITMAICFFSMLFWHLTPSILTTGFILVGMCCAYQILAIYKTSTYVREQVAGLTTAVANMIIMIFGYAFHTSIGGIINFMGGPDLSYTLVYGVAVIPIALCLGTVGFILLFYFSREKVQIEESRKRL